MIENRPKLVQAFPAFCGMGGLKQDFLMSESSAQRPKVASHAAGIRKRFPRYEVCHSSYEKTYAMQATAAHIVQPRNLLPGSLPIRDMASGSRRIPGLQVIRPMSESKSFRPHSDLNTRQLNPSG